MRGVGNMVAGGLILLLAFFAVFMIWFVQSNGGLNADEVSYKLAASVVFSMLVVGAGLFTVGFCGWAPGALNRFETRMMDNIRERARRRHNYR